MQARERTVKHQAELVPKNYESGGQEFESLRVRQKTLTVMQITWTDPKARSPRLSVFGLLWTPGEAYTLRRLGLGIFSLHFWPSLGQSTAQGNAETADMAAEGVWGSQRVGYKLSGHFAGYSMSDSNPLETFSYLAEQLNGLRVGYLHVGEAIAGPMAAAAGTVRITPILRDKFNGTMIVSGGYGAHSGHAAIARGEADLVAFVLANPDLPARYRKDASLNPPDQATFYAGEEKGYIDYPALV
jgi:hypothetical protein